MTNTFKALLYSLALSLLILQGCILTSKPSGKVSSDPISSEQTLLTSSSSNNKDSHDSINDDDVPLVISSSESTNCLTDCFDDACMFTPDCFIETEITIEKCSDGIDNDDNNTADCEDPNCLVFVHCQEPLENTKAQCEDGIDNDQDGLIDCDDDDFCYEFPSCRPQTETTPGQCEDWKDNDGDGLIDCDDPKCQGFEYCSWSKENQFPLCVDGLDNDANGLTDCADEECKLFVFCNIVEYTKETCQDGVDNDDNGTIDCEDSKCTIFTFCSESTEEACQDGIDNDEDGFLDCADDECMEFTFCPAVAPGDTNSGHVECSFEYTEDLAVTIYDHETGPEFKLKNKYNTRVVGEDERGVIKGMVQDELGPNGRPVFKAIPGNSAEITGCLGCGWWNEHIADWWLPSVSVVEYETTLAFEHQGGGVYKFEDENFFPLFEVKIMPDGQTVVHNPITGGPASQYSFTMHMQRTLMYDGVANQQFHFGGDDDVFVFLNGRLVIDLGGPHSPAVDSFDLEVEAAKLGIPVGGIITLDYFSAERLEGMSQVIITTNLACLIQERKGDRALD